ncbi:MAG: hypothetical protein ACXVZP_08400 [Gaiellaceae bacterium]
MRRLFFLLVPLSLLAIGWALFPTGDSKRTPAEAAQIVLDSSLGQPREGLFLAQPGSVPCLLHEGRKQVPLTGVTCTTRVRLRANGSAVVLFAYGWTSRVAGHSFRHAHTWEYLVSRKGEVVSVHEYGDFGPEPAA